MNDLSLRLVLLVGAGIALIGLGISGLMLSRSQRQVERRDLRLASIVTPHLRRTQIEISAFTGPTVRSERSAMSVLGAIFGFDMEKATLYPASWWIILIGTLVVAKIIEYFIGDFLGSLSLASIPVIWVLLSRTFFGYFVKRRQQQLLTEFPDALALVVRAIRVGIPVMEAIRNVSKEAPPATAGEFARLVDQVAVGVSLEDGVREMAHRTGLSEYRFFATTLALQNQTGGTLSDTLEGLADVIRKRAALKSKARALTSEARSSSMVLSILPFVTGLMLWLINPKYIGILFTDPTGKSMLGLAIIMLTTGVITIQMIIKKTMS